MSRNKEKYESTSRRAHTIMSEAERTAGRRAAPWTALEVTGGVRNLAPALWDMSHLTILYLNDNSLQRLPPDIARLSGLRTLDLSNNKLRSLPSEIGDLVNLRELTLHHNYLRALPYELGKLFNLQSLGLHGNPLPKDIFSIYGESNGTHKLLTFLLDSLQRRGINPNAALEHLSHVYVDLNLSTTSIRPTVMEHNVAVRVPIPPQRPWIPLTRPNRTRPTCIFTVMCYNVLCDKYATRQMYGYCPTWALNWEYRKKSILDEIRHYAADIISLQELEMDQFYNYFLIQLKEDGYDGIFSPKSRAKTMSESERKFVDGCAIFFRSAKFTLVKEHLIEFNQLAMANSEGSDNMLNRVMPKDNIGLAALLKTKEAAWENGIPTDSAQIGQPLLVCTAHIHWDPEFSDVKLIQTMMLGNELKSILEEATQLTRITSKTPSGHDLTPPIQLLLCGDFNSLPDSGVIEFLTSGRIPADHRDFKELGYTASLQRISGSERPNEFTHPFKLASAYSEDIMPYTNYTFDFKGIIDYIFYSKQSMTPLGLLGPLSADWFRENKIIGCPHPHIPSDHFPLLVELEMAPSTPQSNGLISRR